ncbi:MAG TPA: alpha/beta fold hydrolase, partial [Planctomycetaceae bacterium]|nr:alpha/beta fold hydrolase [Planctomycetaceae bacterium]
KGGAAFEKIGDCMHDLRAWIDLLAARGYRRIVLTGHSMGAVKAIYSQTRQPHPHVAAILAISPPRFCHDRLANGPRGEQFRSEFARMQDLVAQGRPDALVPVTHPLPFVATPAGYLEKYGPDDPYDSLGFLPQIAGPVLVLIGSESAETSAAFAGAAEAIAELQPNCPGISVEVVAGANINYSNGPQAPFERGVRWLSTLLR